MTLEAPWPVIATGFDTVKITGQGTHPPHDTRSQGGDFHLATSGDLNPATTGDFYMATDTRGSGGQRGLRSFGE